LEYSIKMIWCEKTTPKMWLLYKLRVLKERGAWIGMPLRY